MASIFPVLFDFSIFAVFLLRITTSLFFLTFGLRLMRAARLFPEKRTVVKVVGFLYGSLNLLVAILLLVGMYTQIAAILGVLLAGLTLAQNITSPSTKSSQQVQLLLFVLCLSLLFLGPGWLAVDIPL